MIEISPTNIYNKFLRKFENNFNDFDLSPNNIFQLTKLNTQK